MKIYLIGTGTEGHHTLTLEAAEAIARSELLIGAKRMLEPYQTSGKVCVRAYQSAEIIAALLDNKFEIAAVLFSGDCGFFSGASVLKEQLPDAEIIFIPGISSLAAFCAKIGKSYENMKFVSLHGRDAHIAIHAAANPLCFFLLGGNVRAADLCKQLCAYHLGALSVYIGENLGYPDERISIGKAVEFTDYCDDTLTVLVTENPTPIQFIPSALPDRCFERSKIPMTKAHVRCSAVAALNIKKDGICWDIGCGSGSVSVEMAYRCQDGAVYAFDKNPEAIPLTEKNAVHFFCDNIIAEEGNCPEILLNAPVPDHVFIGGSSGNLRGIFEIIAMKNHEADIVITAVSLETLLLAAKCFDEFQGTFEVVQIAVTETKKVGSHTMLEAQNPVFVISGHLG